MASCGLQLETSLWPQPCSICGARGQTPNSAEPLLDLPNRHASIDTAITTPGPDVPTGPGQSKLRPSLSLYLESSLESKLRIICSPIAFCSSQNTHTAMKDSLL